MFSKDGSVNYVLSNGGSRKFFRTGNFYNWGVELSGVSKKIKVLDTTLRDGEQSPGVFISVNDKIEIAARLEEAGVDVIEAGFPVASPAEEKSVTEINSTVKNSIICGLARCNPKDIESAVRTGVKRIHLFIATSDLHLQYKLRMSREEVMSAVRRSVGSVTERGIEVEFSCEDATRSDMDYLVSVFNTAEEYGARTLNIPDTVGALSPPAMMKVVGEIKKRTVAELSVHCHNDFGLATANTLFGVMGGASQVHVTVNGIGERAGNASMEEVVMGIESFLSSGTSVKKEKLYGLSRIVSAATGMTVQPNKAIVGENAFAHEAGIHVHGMVNEVSTYEPIDPSVVGAERKIVIGKHSGLNSIQWVMKRNGIEADDEKSRGILMKVKQLSENGVRVDEKMVIGMFESNYGIGTSQVEEI